MCTTSVYTYVYPNGARNQSQRLSLCNASRQGRPCRDGNIVLTHPPIMAPFSTPYPTLPPTPPADESDRARHRSSSDQRRSSTCMEDRHHHRHYHHHHQPSHRRLSSSHRERVVLVENPPASRTPPQTYSAPHTAPSSPRVASRPVIVDERQRPTVRIEVPDNHHHRHNRHSSTSSRESSNRPSSRHAEKDHGSHRRRRRSSSSNYVIETEAEARQRRELHIRQRIVEANAEIAGRPPVPLSPAPRRRSSARDDFDRVREAELIETIRLLNLEERRLVQRAEEDRMGRLRERMELPRRRSTVGPGSRRHRVLYDDGLYRWE